MSIFHRFISSVGTKNFPEEFSKNSDLKYLDALWHQGLTLSERSYSQYLAQMKNKRFEYKVFMNALGFMLTPFLLVYSFMCYKFRNGAVSHDCEGVSLFPHTRKFIPMSLIAEFGLIGQVRTGHMISIHDLIWYSSVIFSHPLSYLFHFNNIRKLAIYRNVIEKCRPRAIIVSSEGSWSSSILTLYLRARGIIHINYMHGEKMLSLNDCFAIFDRFYVWHEYYKNISIRLHCQKDGYFVENMAIPITKVDPSTVIMGKLVYYLQYESIYETRKLLNILTRLNKKFDVYVRPHPRNPISLKSILVQEFKVDTTPIDESLASTELIVSKYSSVLTQGFFMSKKVVIDDCSNPRVYQKLIESEYFLCNNNVLRLSDLFKEEN